MKSVPRVSVIMPVYNAEPFVGQALKSILDQTFRDFELIIVDDGSGDRSREIVHSFHDERIVSIENGRNLGLTASLNVGLEKARGEFIARQDADDLSLPERLEKQVAFLDSHPTVGLVGCALTVINDVGNALTAIPSVVEPLEISAVLSQRNPIAHGTAVIRRTCLEKTGPYREEFPYAQDYDLWLRIAEIAEVANIPGLLYQWRITRGSITLGKKRLQDRFSRLAAELALERRTNGKDRLQIAGPGNRRREDLIPRSRPNRRKAADDYRFWSWLAMESGYRGLALTLIMRALTADPLRPANWKTATRNLIGLFQGSAGSAKER